MVNDGLNPKRKEILRRLFQKEKVLIERTLKIRKAIDALGKEFWKNEGYFFARPNTRDALERAVNKED